MLNLFITHSVNSKFFSNFRGNPKKKIKIYILLFRVVIIIGALHLSYSNIYVMFIKTRYLLESRTLNRKIYATTNFHDLLGPGLNSVLQY